MRTVDSSKLESIRRYIEAYYKKNFETPSIRDISIGTGIPTSTVHRCLKKMNESGEITYEMGDGYRSMSTRRMQKENNDTILIPILGHVSCGHGDIEEQEVLDFIKMPKTMMGNGQYFALQAQGESMVDAGIYPNDYVIVRQQQEANSGDIVVALYEGLNNLKQLEVDGKNMTLCSCNKDKATFPDIPVKDVRIQGVAVGTYHKFV